MNILQITNYGCAPLSANDNTGINRVVTALCGHFLSAYDYNCFNAYYTENPSGLSESFKGGMKMDYPFDNEAFRRYLTENQIDIVVINVSNLAYVKEIPRINEVAHVCKAKTVYCIHFIPGYETRTYFDSRMLYFNVAHGIKAMDSLKKAAVAYSRPLSSAIIKRMIRSRYGRPLETSDAVAVFADSYIDQYLDFARSDRRDKFAVIPNPLPFRDGIDAESLADKKKEVLVVGRLYEPQKRLRYAFEVWKMIEQDPGFDDWKLLVVGDGASRKYYEWLVRKMGLKNVQFCGSQNPRPFYQRASILLSTSAYEGWPMVLMECMPMGVVPCVFNSYAASGIIIDHNVNGMIAPDNDLDSFCHCLKELMSDEHKRIRMAGAAVEKSESFESGIIGDLWRKLFERLIQN